MIKFLPTVSNTGPVLYLNPRNIESMEYVVKKRLTIAMVSGRVYSWSHEQADLVWGDICVRLDLPHDQTDRGEKEDPETPGFGRMKPPVGA